MPYIKQEQRDRLAEGDFARTGGEVNYLVTLLMNAYFESYDDAEEIASDIEYAISGLISNNKLDLTSEFGTELIDIIMKAEVSNKRIVGALRNAFSEFYVRKVRPYEDIKIKENGDV